MSNRILLRGGGVRVEKDADVALTPGELLDESADGEWLPHGDAGQNAQKIFCLEREMVGDDIDTDYAAGDRVVAIIAKRGSLINAFLAAGENVNNGDPLESDGAGALQAHTPQAVDEGGTATYTVYVDAIVAYAAEDNDNSGGTDRVRHKVQVA